MAAAETPGSESQGEAGSAELNLGEDVVKIAIDLSKLHNSMVLEPTALFNTLQQQITNLQAVAERLRPLSDKGNGVPFEDINTGEREPHNEAMSSQISADRANSFLPAAGSESSKVGESENAHFHIDPDMVQIKAGKSEIERRISAFMERKQAEINENNVREFCNVIDCNQENSCARIDAIFTPYPGFKSHVKVSRVVNTYGPQTRPEGHTESCLKSYRKLNDCGNPGIEERLQNVECHLKMQTGGPVPVNIYQRIKRLEDRILELEGLSPEYFQQVNFSNKRQKVQDSQNYNLAELDEKIKALKAALLRKADESQPMDLDNLMKS
nr:PREDICTED: MAP3K12-binding inhibitory protein 1 isoform X2 [Latimeria chalumnae]|eukprot:XP_014340079.1 PREDICTED: MAP3K12-binding inhibitory protein 1 isoform X2 [Latimeria chalumnae]